MSRAMRLRSRLLSRSEAIEILPALLTAHGAARFDGNNLRSVLGEQTAQRRADNTGGKTDDTDAF